MVILYICAENYFFVEILGVICLILPLTFTILKKKEGGAGTLADIHMCEKATVTGDVYKNYDPEKDDAVYFLLQDSTHQFTIGLSDILRRGGSSETSWGLVEYTVNDIS